MSVISQLRARLFPRPPAPATTPPEAHTLPGESLPGTRRSGRTPTPENQTKYLYRIMWVDPDLRATIQEIRRMDARDGRVKKIHARTARAAVKGGLRLVMTTPNRRIERAWGDFERRLGLHRREKLESDMAGLMMEGNLPLQWVLDAHGRVAQAVRMPTETILPNVDQNGQFKDLSSAYHQYDLTTGLKVAEFALWQLTMVRLSPQNFDDMGALGRPYLDASRSVWKKLNMTEEDLVIRRRQRAPLRTAHTLEGATDDELKIYKARVEEDETAITTNYYLNKKGTVQAVQGDANLDQIGDVVHLLDTFFAGAPAPKALFGFTEGLNRDILEDLKRDYFDELDALQDVGAFGYRIGFELDLLLRGINPHSVGFDVQFAERRTDTANQRADLALKHQAMGVPRSLVFEAAGLDPARVRAVAAWEASQDDPYPDPNAIAPSRGAPPGTPRVSVTPGNRRKGESGTDISLRG